ncbi:hypothetical protein ACLBXM_02280 [Xanthobacteraceae bacterium A53D]
MNRPATTLDHVSGSDWPGQAALVEWFGRMPGFHDAELLELRLVPGGESVMRLHAWLITDRLDANGYFISDRHAQVKLVLDRVTRVACTDMDLFPAIVLRLDIVPSDAGVQIVWETSYGVEGMVEARALRFELAPGRP